MNPEEVPAELVQATVHLLAGTSYWTGWRPEHAEQEIRGILATALPLYEQQLRAHIADAIEQAPDACGAGGSCTCAGYQRDASISVARGSNPLGLTADDAIAGIGAGTAVPAKVLTALRPGIPTPKPRTVLVAGHRGEFELWCHKNKRSRYDPRIIHIADGRRDAHKLQGLADFDLVVLSEIPHHNEAMQLISHRLATRPPQDSAQ